MIKKERYYVFLLKFRDKHAIILIIVHRHNDSAFQVLHLSGRQALLISTRGILPFFISISKDNGPAVSLCDSQWSGWIAVDYWQITWPRKQRQERWKEISRKCGTKRVTINHEDNERHVLGYHLFTFVVQNLYFELWVKYDRITSAWIFCVIFAIFVTVHRVTIVLNRYRTISQVILGRTCCSICSKKSCMLEIARKLLLCIG